MSNRFPSLLATWRQNKDRYQWVLATVVATDGSSYRKAGARMMINDLGQHYGMLSGGCLESDIILQARRCWEDGRNRILEYDTREEDDLAWKLGLGCGGMVRILLQPVSAKNKYLLLEQLHEKLLHNHSVYYQQALNVREPENHILDVPQQSEDHFCENVAPAPHLAIFGAGADARPLVSIAAELGWRTTLVDSRPAYGREKFFPLADQIVREPFGHLISAPWLRNISAAVVMTHNLKMDADAITLCQSSSAGYLGLLGPAHRTDWVLDVAGLDRAGLCVPLANPVGLELGGELPESIALAILAEAHAYLERASARPISNILTRE